MSTAPSSSAAPALAVAALGALTSATFPLTATLALGDIGGALSASADEAAWLVTLYNLGRLAGLPFTFVLAASLGRRRAMQTAAGLFALGSLGMAMVHTLPAALTLRALQGLGGGMLPVLMFLILFSTVPPGPGRIRALAGFAAATTLGTGLAAGVGSLLLATGGWRALFAAQAVLGGLYLLLAQPLFRSDPWQPAVARQTDWVGYTLITLGLSGVSLGLSEGERHFWWQTRWIGASLLAGGVLLLAAIVHVRRSPAPLLRPSLFAKPFSLGLLLQVLYRFSTLVLVWITPQYLVRLAGFRIEQLAWAQAPLALGIVLGILLALWSSPRCDQRIVLCSGLLLFASAAGLCATASPDWRLPEFLLPAALAGLGQGLFCMSTLHFVLIGLERSEGPTCGMGFNYAGVLGEIAGLAFYGHLVAEQEKLHSARLGEPLSLLDPALLQGLQQGGSNVAAWLDGSAQAQAVATAALAQRVATQAYALAYTDAFTVALCVALFAAWLAWALPACRGPRTA